MENNEKNSVLIVDDENINLEILYNILASDYTVFTTKSGISAVEMAKQNPPDIILLDIIMPDMNGYEVLKTLKKADKTKNIPVIFITGLDGVEAEEKGLGLEAADFIHKPFSVEIVKLRVRNQIQIVNQIRAIEDYTRKMEQVIDVLASTEEKSKFFAKMSHEMRTPLNAVIGLSEMIMEEGGLSEGTWENVEKISSAGATLLSMVNDILDISKIESDKFKLIPIEYDTVAMINDTVTQSIMSKGEKKLEFSLNVDPFIPVRLYGDDIRVKQIFNNLLSNAFKYTKEGTVEFNIKSEKVNDDVWLIASVKDTGIGISAENLNNMFLEYSRLDMDSKANSRVVGTGLGLSITKMLLDIMGGTISVESEYGKGSCFSVQIPQKFVTADIIGAEITNSLKRFQYSSRKHQQKSRVSRISLPYAHVLVVDDVITNLHVAKGMMKPYGMQVDCVTSGQEAIDAIRSEKVKYNAIFMDHMMPEMDGIEATRIIREEIGTDYAKRIPIIAFTANALTGNEEMFLNNGFQAFLTKPIEIPNLDAIIRQWVRNEEQEKELAQKKVTVGEETFFDPRKGKDRRSGKERRKGYDRRLFEERIEGMDMRKGLERFAGDRDTFLQILISFIANTRFLINTMREVTKENLAAYAINVHGVKSSCRGICAEDLGNRAEDLEMHSKAGDLAYVQEKNPSFIEDMLKLIARINNALAAGGAIQKDKMKRARPYKEALEDLKKACEEFKIEDIDNSMCEIESFEYIADAGLAAWLRENVDQMNYTEIVERISSLEY
jgi:signal transduction histidine kinase